VSESTDVMTVESEVIQSKYPGLLGRAHTRISEYREVKRFVKFAIVGGIGFVIDAGTSNLLWSILPRDISIPVPFLEPISYIGLGGAIGFVAAVISNFLWNRYWTYPDSRSKSPVLQLITFFVINLFGIIIRIPILEFASIPFSALAASALPILSAEFALRIGKNMALLISVGIAMIWNFFVNRYLTYSDVK